MSAHIDSFLDYLRLERAYSPRTVQSYEMDLNEFEAYLRRTDAELTLETVDADNVRNWTMEMMEAGQKETSVNRRLSALRSFYRYLLRKGVVEVSPMQTVRGPKKRKPLPFFLREEEMDNLLKEENFGYEFQGERDRLILMMFYEMGLRRAELVGLNEGDVDFYRDQIKVTGKRNKQRLIPFGDELKSALQSYMALKAQEVSAPEDGALFVQKDGRRVTDAWVYTMVRRNLTKVTSIKKRSPHVLRHTFATTMLNHDAELEAVKELLGHESVATTEIYTHTTFEELKNAYSKAHPRARK
jgi:Site-specific recombinase XerD